MCTNLDPGLCRHFLAGRSLAELETRARPLGPDQCAAPREGRCARSRDSDLSCEFVRRGQLLTVAEPVVEQLRGHRHAEPEHGEGDERDEGAEQPEPQTRVGADRETRLAVTAEATSSPSCS